MEIDTARGDYVFFAADSQHARYECVQNVCASQNYVSEFELRDYPVTQDDILHRGREAWDAALNTVNIGKYNLGWASIGICTHALYEAITHASNRVLYKMHVTDFSHVRQMFVDAYCRLVAMKLFALRAADYLRTASAEDRRYLLYNPMVKMKVTTQGEDVINLLWDVIAAKGFEKDMYFSQAAVDIRALPKLGDAFYVLYGDSYLPTDYQAVGRAFQASGRQGLMTVFENRGRYETSNVWFEDGRIRLYSKTEKPPQMRHIDYGLGVFRAAAFAGGRRS